jgi:hypothetical protein
MSKEEKESSKQEDLKKVERAKFNALLAGVFFFMLLIIILWATNLPNIFKTSPKKSASQFNASQLTREFQTSFSQVKAKIGDLKALGRADLQKYAATSTASSTLIEK